MAKASARMRIPQYRRVRPRHVADSSTAGVVWDSAAWTIVGVTGGASRLRGRVLAHFDASLGDQCRLSQADLSPTSSTQTWTIRRGDPGSANSRGA